MSLYPGGLDEFTRKSDNQDTILAGDVNDLQSAVENIEDALGTYPAGSADTVAERLDDIEDSIDNITVEDTAVNLSEGNVGDHDTLDEHVKDSSIHASLDSLAYNYPRMLDMTLDQMLRGVLSSAYHLNYDNATTSSSFNLSEGDVVFCHPVANPSGSSYNWYMVTMEGSDLASGSSLRFNDSAGAPVFADGSWITRYEADSTFPEDFAGELNIDSGDLVFAYPLANPSGSSYGWLMATASASISSEIRLNDEGSAPTFATDSRISVFSSVSSAYASDSALPCALGDVVFCYPTSDPAGTGYGWHMVTAGSSSGPSGVDLRLDDEASAPTFSVGSQFSKFATTLTAPVTDSEMPVAQGDLAYCFTTANPSASSYGWHMVTSGVMGVSGSDLRLDDAIYAPSYNSGSQFTKRTSFRYQGVAQGGEVLEIVYVPCSVILNSVGTGTDPDSAGEYPSVYGNISLKFPLGGLFEDRELTAEPLELSGSGDPLPDSAFRNRVVPVFEDSTGYFPEVGMYVALGSSTSAGRGVQGLGIVNRTEFGAQCDGNPVISVKAPKLAESGRWVCYLPVLARVLDNNDNSQVDVGDYVTVILSSQGESDSPCVSTATAETNAVDIFKIPSSSIYTGTGADGDLVVDGTYAENSTDNIVHDSTTPYLIDSVKNYTGVTVQNAGVISCTSWNYASQSFGRILFYVKGPVFVDSTSKISTGGKGYEGGKVIYYSNFWHPYQGESYTGQGLPDVYTPNGGGGGARNGTYGGGGGGYGTEGGSGSSYGSPGGYTYGTPDLAVLYRGSGGGGYHDMSYNRNGKRGGGIVRICADSITVQTGGSIDANGTDSGDMGGAGSGGSVYLRANTLNLGIGQVTATGGAKLSSGGEGGDGRVRFDYGELGSSESDPPAYKYRL